MSKFNPTKKEIRVANNGALAVNETTYGKLKRLVGMYLINDERTYDDGNVDISQEIIRLTSDLSPSQFKKLVEKTRFEYGLRHTPLLLIIGALRSETLRTVISEINPKILNRPSDTMDLIAIYKKYNSGRTIPNQIKKLISKALNNFDEYQLSKYSKTTKKEVNLKDVINLTHPKPKNSEQEKLFKGVLKGNLPSPMTWEVHLSNTKDKKQAWEDLLDTNKLPALATIRNIRNMIISGVDEKKIAKYIDGLKSNWIFPFQIITVMTMLSSEVIKKSLENYLIRMSNSYIKLDGLTYIVLDISGSMGSFIQSENAKKAFSMAYSLILASENCKVFLTAGNDYEIKHKTKLIKTTTNIDKFLNEIYSSAIGHGGIFTAQAIDWIDNQNYDDEVDRVVVISDSQDCDRNGKKAKKIANYMYVNNIAAYNRIAFTDNNKPFDADITTFSSRIIDFIKFHEE